MTGRQEHPRFAAIRIGPGGVPADQIRAVGVDPPTQPAPVASPQQGRQQGGGPSAVFGSFDQENARPSRRAVLGWLGVLLAAAVIVAAFLLSGAEQPIYSSADLQPGACLASSAGQAVVIVNCSTPAADFTVAARIDDSTDAAGCAAVSSDVVLVTRDHAVLCLNYRAIVGDCLYAGRADDVGKAPCRTPGSSSTPRGLFRVIAVLSGTVDPKVCPAGTITSLVHRPAREVLCLGLP
jgi:hypothetical protein